MLQAQDSPGQNGSNYSVNSGITIFNASRITNLIKQAELEIEGGNILLKLLKNQSVLVFLMHIFRFCMLKNR